MQNLRNRVDVKLVNNKKQLFDMGIQTKLRNTKNIWQKFGRDSQKSNYFNNYQISISWNVYMWIKWSANVWIPVWLYQKQI